MTDRFSRRFRVRHYELDQFGHVRRVELVRYMQEAAIEASTALGFSPEWYAAHGVGWVVRRLSVRCDAPATYGDEIEARTWLSLLRGVRSVREYDLRRIADGARVARGRAEWVYVESQTGQPTRVPDEWAAAPLEAGPPEDLRVRLSNPRPTSDPHRYTSRRRVQFHELDTVRHVNHAVYLQWAEQAQLDALRAAGHAVEGPEVRTVGHEIQYFAGALADEEVEVVSWIGELAEGGAAWTHEISNATTGKLLARDYCAIRLESAPARLLESLLRGAPHAPSS